MKRTISILASAIIALAGAKATHGCVCNVRSLSKRVRESRCVFVGTITNRTPVSEHGRTFWRNEFAVERYWKGERSANLVVYTTVDDCAPSLEINGKYLVFAYFVKDEDHLETDLCMRTARVDLVPDDLDKLGKGKLPANAGDVR